MIELNPSGTDIRHQVQDDWEPQRLDFQAKLGKILSPEWRIDADVDSFIMVLYGRDSGGDGKLGYDCCL